MDGPTDHRREAVEARLRSAFAGVRLGGGVSLAEAEWADGFGATMTMGEANRRRAASSTDDWTRVDPSDRGFDFMPHLDAEGLRYYLPPVMLRLLDEYDPMEHWCLIAIHALDHADRHPLGFLELLTDHQRAAVAAYVQALPELVDLRYDDAEMIERCFADVWQQHLPQRDAKPSAEGRAG